MEEAGRLFTPERVYSIASSGSTLYAAAYTAGLLIVDATDPAQMQILGVYDTERSARDVALVGQAAFVADESEGLLAIDVSDPQAPKLIDHLDGMFVSRVHVVDGIAYLGGYLNGEHALGVVDVSDPSALDLLGSCILPAGITDLDVEDGYAFVTMPSLGRATVDIADPASPMVATTFLSHPMGLDVSDGHGFLATEDGLFQVLDLSDPLHPVLIGSVEYGHDGSDVSVAGAVAYAASFITSELTIIDIRDPSNPVARNTFDANSLHPLRGLTVQGDHIYLAASVSGIFALDLVSIDCLADMNGDCSLDFFDISSFLSAFVSDDPAADLSEPYGEFNFFDVSAFLNYFGQGCP